MGDLIKFTTWPQHQYIFYKITSGTVTFSVKGERHAVVGLARRPGEKCDYWIVIGPGHCWLEKDRSRLTKIKEVTNLLSSDEFYKFWISWHSGRLQFGCTNNGIPLLNKKLPLSDIQYVTFSVYADRGTMHWKLYLPPKLEKPLLKILRGGEMQWVIANDQLPDGALIGGYENEILYIMRSTHRGSVTPGKFVPSQGAGFIPWGGEMHEKNKFQVLCGYNCIWVPTCGDRIPVGAVEAGHSEDLHEILYVGRAIEDGFLIPGKVQPSHAVCYIPYNEREIAKREYEILVDPEMATGSLNDYFISHMDQRSLTRPEDDDDDDAYVNIVWGPEDCEQSSTSD